MQQGSCSGNQLHAIRMRLKDGRKFTLADEIDSRQEARWVVSQIETLAGLRLDTHVEVDLPLGVPPQPLRPTSGQVFTPSRSSTSTTASLGVFFAMVTGMIGFMVWRTNALNGGRSAVTSSADTLKGFFDRTRISKDTSIYSATPWGRLRPRPRGRLYRCRS